MSLPFTFGTVAAGAQVPGSKLDDNFNALGAMTVIPCTATGTNAISLTPLANTTVPTAYANYQMFGFVALNTTSGAVTAAFQALGTRNVYLANGTTQAGSGDIVAGVFYIIAFNQALNGGAGGFEIMSPATNLTPGIASPVSTKVGDYTVLTTDRGGELRMNSAAAHTFNLLSGATAGNGFNAQFMNINTGPATIAANGTDKILSKGTQLASIVLPSAGDAGNLISDGGSPAIWSWKGKRTFTSTDFAYANSQSVVTPHTLGVVPDSWDVYLVNAIANLNYNPGDVLDTSTFASAAAAAGWNSLRDATNITVIMGPNAVAIANKTTFATTVITVADWNMRIVARVEN